MNILMLAINDPAGTAIAFCKALNAHTGHRARVATLETRYTHGWEKDLHLPDLDADGLDELRDLMAGADVLHFHMTADEHTEFGPLVPRDFMAGKLIAHHHHGHPNFRGNPGKYHDKYKELNRTNIMVSTPDLLKLLPEARWQPNLVPVNDPLYSPLDGEKPFPPLLIAHSPTRKDLKNTDDLIDVVSHMKIRRAQLEMDLMDDVPHVQCLERKRKCHVLFDHMQGYYGVSSLEGLSQGLAVIAGLDDWNRGHVSAWAGTEDLPWLVAREPDALTLILTALLNDPDLLRETGEKSRGFMLEHWSDAKAAAYLADFYENAV